MVDVSHGNGWGGVARRRAVNLRPEPLTGERKSSLSHESFDKGLVGLCIFSDLRRPSLYNSQHLAGLIVLLKFVFNPESEASKLG